MMNFTTIKEMLSFIDTMKGAYQEEILDLNVVYEFFVHIAKSSNNKEISITYDDNSVTYNSETIKITAFHDLVSSKSNTYKTNRYTYYKKGEVKVVVNSKIENDEVKNQRILSNYDFISLVIRFDDVVQSNLKKIKEEKRNKLKAEIIFKLDKILEGINKDLGTKYKISMANDEITLKLEKRDFVWNFDDVPEQNFKSVVKYLHYYEKVGENILGKITYKTK